ncbi:hypothetical protein GL65_24960 [Salmonella enterica subsp. enterica serovar Typhimurium]|nr:hypothetical protein [Salmonella enterica subsp. enterica serovar Typhimurium]MBB7508368.1 hypothetical protein [Escherichia coli]EED3900768.1 hypothetical protein [Salmonella enterica subsp. enterica serovar Typhimurium]HBM9617619.1 hypothetical protein [Escherichia coli]HCK2092257.1 hypothetical protein [Escherichia coli]
MPFEQKKARAIALMDSKKMWRSNYAPPLLRILWRLGIRLPPLPFMPFTYRKLKNQTIPLSTPYAT